MSPLFITTLTLVSGVCWTIVYIDIINRGLRDQACGMPFFALAFNITWEFIYAFLIYQGLPLQRLVNVVWFLLDLGILYTYFRFGRQEFPRAYAGLFIPWSLAALAAAFLTLYVAGSEFPGTRGGTYSAFAQNFMMSILFIAMLVRRGDVRGQSMYIALFKWLGTLAPTFLVTLATGSRLVLILGVCSFFFDLVYIVMLYRQFVRAAINPWTRQMQSSPASSVVK